VTVKKIGTRRPPYRSICDELPRSGGMTFIRIFISSVQKELAEERRALFDYIRKDPLLRRFYDVFLFEDLPASGRRPDEAYLAEVDRCGIYLCLLGNVRPCGYRRSLTHRTGV
jgi:hypothetical protein